VKLLVALALCSFIALEQSSAQPTKSFSGLQPDRAHIEPRYLLHYCRSPVFLEALLGTMNPNVGVPTLGLGVIRETAIPVPSLSEQRRIVAELDDLQAQVESLKRVQAETATEIDALLPAILDRAFKGELA
jgi:type I restriction enzyme S subunit